ncbi:MAG: M28 family metallopeptidase [Promethearchaeota archaeon]
MTPTSNIKQILEQLSFPRVSGSRYEKEAYEFIKKEVEKLNLKTETQKFTFTSFYSRILPKLFFFLTFILLLSFSFINYIAMILSSLGMLVVVIAGINPRKSKIGKKFSSQTLYTKIDSKNEKSDPYDFLNIINKDSKHIVLMAHLDSKGQRLTIRLRIYSFKLWSYSYILGLIFIIINNYVIQNSVVIFFIAIFLLLNLLTTILVLVNTTDNKSPGAIDNGSGVVVLYEILCHFSIQENKLNNINLWFAFTGAEECGTMGARNLLEIMRKISKKKNIMIVNFDGIAKGVDYFSGIINPKRNIELYNRFIEHAKDLDINFAYSNRIFGIRSDGLYLKNKGYEGFGFGDYSTYKYYHSKDDSIDKIDIRILENLSKFVIRALVEIDNDHIL